MEGEIKLISDGDGVAVIGDAAAVDLLLKSVGLLSRDLVARSARTQRGRD